MRKGERPIGLTVLVLSAVLIALTPSQIAERLIGSRSIPFPPYAMPLIALSMMLLLSAVWLFVSFRKGNIEETGYVSEGFHLRVVITFGLLTLGVIGLDFLGFISATFLLTGVLLFYFGVRNWKTILILSAVISVFTYLFFDKLMQVPLPEGFMF